jgi:photosystem II stability/assembly factor-like uncharacterized protein
MNIQAKIAALCTVLLAWCSPAAAQLEWTRIYSDTTLYMGALYFTSDSVVYGAGSIGGAGFVRKSTDAGNTWGTPYFVNKDLLNIFFPTDSVGYAVGANEVYKSTDAGATWTTSAIFNTNVFLKGLYFTSRDTGITVMENTGNGQLPFFRTFNGGNTWQAQFNDTVMGNDVFFTDRDNGFSVRDRIYKSQDQGNTWDETNLYNTHFTGVHFVTDSIGYACGFITGQSPCWTIGIIAKTTDLGSSWDTTSFECNGFWDVNFPTIKYGYAVGGYNFNPNVVWVTADEGATWAPSIVDTVGYAFNIYCTDSLTCYVTTNNGIYKTTNGGGVGITEQTRTDDLQVNVYPNPANGQITVTLDVKEKQDIRIEFYNLLGELIKGDDLGQQEGEVFHRFDLSARAPGMYVIKVAVGDKSVSRKVIKQN